VLGRTLRYGQPFDLTDEQYEQAKPQLAPFVNDGLITVTPVGAAEGYEMKKAKEEAEAAEKARIAEEAKAAEEKAAAELKAKLEAEVLAKAQEVVGHDPIVPFNVTPAEMTPPAPEPVQAPQSKKPGKK